MNNSIGLRQQIQNAKSLEALRSLESIVEQCYGMSDKTRRSCESTARRRRQQLLSAPVAPPPKAEAVNSKERRKMRRAELSVKA